jgi:hypothetical protein
MDRKKIIEYLLSPALWIAIALIAVVVLLYRIFSPKDFKKLPVNEWKLSYPVTRYQSIVADLINSMYGLGTDETLLFSSLKNLNVDDLKMVYNEFGFRKLGDTNWTKTVTEESKDLISWLKEELSGADLVRAEMIFKPTGLWI